MKNILKYGGIAAMVLVVGGATCSWDTRPAEPCLILWVICLPNNEISCMNQKEEYQGVSLNLCCLGFDVGGATIEIYIFGITDIVFWITYS